MSAPGDPVRCSTIKIAIWIIVSAGYVVIVATRFHYSVDVFLGVTLAVLVWKFYHEFIRSIHMRSPSPELINKV